MEKKILIDPENWPMITVYEYLSLSHTKMGPFHNYDLDDVLRLSYEKLKETKSFGEKKMLGLILGMKNKFMFFIKPEYRLFESEDQLIVDLKKSVTEIASYPLINFDGYLVSRLQEIAKQRKLLDSEELQIRKLMESMKPKKNPE